ncbi:hypothetical protein [Roseibium sp. MB-4]
MAHYISRKALYDLVWSEPLKILAPKFDVSDVSLRKACQRAMVPTPDRGHWAKKAAGKRTVKIPLAPRPPGMSHEVTIGGNQYNYRYITPEEHRGPLPPSPTFPEPIEQIRARIERTIGKVKAPKQISAWHPAIKHYFNADEKRRTKLAESRFMASWYEPLFDNSIEQRRFRFLNSLFFAVSKFHGKPTIRGTAAREIQLVFHKQAVSVKLDRPGVACTDEYSLRKATKNQEKRLRFDLGFHGPEATPHKTWVDNADGKLESYLTEIAIEVVLYAETQYRAQALSHYDWRKKRKAQIEEEDRQRAIAAVKAEEERLERLKQERIDSLLSDANAYRKAAEIRAYAEAVSQAIESGETAVDQESLIEWRNWALNVADEIDPVNTQSFLKTMERLRG